MISRKQLVGLLKPHSPNWNRMKFVLGLKYYSDQQLVVAKQTGISLKTSKKPSRGPFMKNIFLGKFDLEMLVYPELDKERLEELRKRVEPYKDYFKNNVDPSSISLMKMIPNEVMQSLKNLGLFGQVIPFQYGGFDQTAVESAFISEVTAKDLNIALTLYSHNFLAVQTLAMYGTQQQKDKYFPRLATGDCIAAFCMSESSSGSDILTLDSKLQVSEKDPKIFTLNGEKKWVINGNRANLFVVVTKIDHRTHIGKAIPLVRIVLVEKDCPGVTISSPKENMGLPALNMCDVQFKDTPVYADCLIGTEKQGFEICREVLNSGRFNIGAITLSLLKDLLRKTTDFIITRKQLEKPLLECELIHDKVAAVASCIYTLESMTYHTAFILDNYENPDCSLELAIIKVFSFTEGRRCMDLLMELMGGRAFSDSETLQRYFRDFRTMEMFDGTTDVAKLFISLVGLQYAGVTLNETVAKMRFPFEYPNFMLKRIFTHRRQLKDNPKLDLNLYEQLHPSLTEAANQLEYCVHRFQFAVNVFFARYGSDVVNQQIELMRLADAAVKIYAMTTVLSRASRSYCIGVRNAESEIKYAIKLCIDYKRDIQVELNEIITGIEVTGDIFSLKFGSNVLKHHGYFLEHALERTF